MQRPPTSKPRGLCRYFKDPRGCYAGDNCKFIHADALPGPSDPPLLTPYDKNKRCKFYDQGYCKRGATCWFLHVDDDKPQASDEDEPLCSICFEKPSTYGLLIQCSHIFCIDCIKQWRDPIGKPPDTVSSGSIKSCPMCRTLSTSIVPSSRFYPHTSEGRARIVKQYRESTARVDCRYFQKSLAKYPDKPLCPFGSECMYRHCKADGTVVQLQDKAAVAMRRYHASMDGNRAFVSDFFWTQFLPETTADVSEAIRRHVEEMRRQAAAAADNDLLESLDSVVPGMEEATRRTQAAIRTMELMSDALVAAGRQSLDLQSVMQQFQHIRDELIRIDDTGDAGINLDEQLDERRRASSGTRAMRYVRDLGNLADGMLASINGVLNDEFDAAGEDAGNAGVPNPPVDMPGLIPVSRAPTPAERTQPMNPANAPRNPNTAVRSGRPVSVHTPRQAALRIQSPTIIMRHLPPFVQAAASAALTAPGAEPPNLSVDLGLALASATTVISLTEDAIRTERRAQDVLARTRPGTQTGVEAQRLLAESRAVLPVLRTELETSRTRLREMETETLQQRLLVNERMDMLNDVMASVDARAAQQQQRARRPPADAGDDGSDDGMPGLRSVSSSSDEAESEDGMPELRSVSASSDEGEEDGDTDDSDVDEQAAAMLMRALAAVVTTDDAAEGAAAMERLGALVGPPGSAAAAAPTAGVNSPRFSTVVDRTASGTPVTSASTPVPSSADTGSANTAPQPDPSTSTSPPAPTTTVEREPARTVGSAINTPRAAQAGPSASTSSPRSNPAPPADAKSNPPRRTSGDFTTDGRGRVISIGGGGHSREGLHWPVEVPDVAEDDSANDAAAANDNEDEDEDSGDGEDPNEDADTLAGMSAPDPPRAVVQTRRKVSEFTTDGRGRVISVDSVCSTSTDANTSTSINASTSTHTGICIGISTGTSTGDTAVDAVAATAPPAEPSPSSGTGGLLGWFGSFF